MSLKRYATYTPYFIPRDRHAIARDDTEIQLSLRGSKATAAISREGGFLIGIFFSLWSWDISLALNMTYFFASSFGGSVGNADDRG